MNESKSEDESIITNEDIKPISILPIQTQYTSSSSLSLISLKDELSENCESDTYEENDDVPQRRQKKTRNIS